MGTSNAESGFRYGVPVFGTAGHSWVMSFPNELAAFERLQELLGESTVYLIDTYETKIGPRTGARSIGLGRGSSLASRTPTSALRAASRSGGLPARAR